MTHHKWFILSHIFFHQRSNLGHLPSWLYITNIKIVSMNIGIQISMTKNLWESRHIILHNVYTAPVMCWKLYRIVTRGSCLLIDQTQRRPTSTYVGRTVDYSSGWEIVFNWQHKLEFRMSAFTLVPDSFLCFKSQDYFLLSLWAHTMCLSRAAAERRSSPHTEHLM